MIYQPYADEDYYTSDYDGEVLTGKDIKKYLKQASRHVDTLTYNRIVGRGFTNLASLQQDIIRETVCKQAEFEFQNKDVFDMILSGYSINSVSMQFGESWNVVTKKGIPVRRDVYEYLAQTGLTCRLARRW